MNGTRMVVVMVCGSDDSGGGGACGVPYGGGWFGWDLLGSSFSLCCLQEPLVEAMVRSDRGFRKAPGCLLLR